MSLRKELDKYFFSMDLVIDKDFTEGVLKIFEKRIDNLVSRAALTLEPLNNSEWNDALYKVKEMLK